MSWAGQFEQNTVDTQSRKMSYELSTGALLRIMNGEVVPQPVFQVIQTKKIQSNTDKERHRLLLSDGKYLITSALLTGVPNPQQFMIIRLKKYHTSDLETPNKAILKALLILDVDIIASGSAVSHQIGNPIILPKELIANTKINDGSSPASVDSKEAKTEEPSYSDSHPIRQENSSILNHSLSESRVINQITALTPYHNKWVIKARVSNKSELSPWSTSRGEGNLFSVDLMDESGEIRCTAFNDLADKYFNFLQVDKIYYFSKCKVQHPSDKRYNTLKNEYEMTIGKETVIEECLNDDGLVPRQVKYNFVPIDQAALMEIDSLVDVIGICKEVSELQTFTARTSNRELKKREIALMDQSKTSITVNLWNAQAESFDGKNNQVLVIRGARVGEFGGGKNLSAYMSSQIKINPDIPECYRIKNWFDMEGKDSDIRNLSESIGGSSFQTQWMCLKEVQEKGLGNSTKGDYFQTLATILLIRSENALYRACPTPECNKKVAELENGMYRCDKCSREYPNFKYRLLAYMNIGDFSGNQWVTAFSNEAEKILGKTSQELGVAMADNAEVATAIFQAANFKQFIFKCRAKLETFNDEQRLKTVVVNVEPVNQEKHNCYWMGEIKKYMGFTDD